MKNAAAELIWAVGIAAVLILLPQTVYRMFRPGGRLRRTILYRRIMGLAAAGLAVYAGFCLLWGVNYYGDSFSDKSGIQAEPVSTAQLTATARKFAALANEYSEQVARDDAGLFAVSRDEIFARSQGIYDAVGETFPFLSGDYPGPKRVFFSKIMSYIDFTGFYFPFTGESNLNVDSPACMLPSTIAHELAHQRNIAPEQEANFVAVLAALEDAPLVEVVRNGEGEVQAVEVRMQAVNRVKLRITEQILRNLRQAGDSGRMKIPLGSLLGSGLLAGKGPGLTYRFLPEGSVSTRILSRFEACGVNQTRHQLLLSVEVQGCAILSRCQVEVEVPTEYVLAETVVVGTVPESYTQVLTGDSDLVREINDYQAEIRP